MQFQSPCQVAGELAIRLVLSHQLLSLPGVLEEHQTPERLPYELQLHRRQELHELY